MERWKAGGIILAGGRSSRIGRDKSRLEFGGVELAQRTVDFIGDRFSEVIFVTNQPQTVPWRDDLIVVQDEVPFQGPLGGILAGLQTSDYNLNFLIGVDMPFLNEKLIAALMTYDAAADAVVPRLEGGLEPLHAVYSKNCLPAIRSRLKRGDYRMASFLEDVSLIEVGEAELRLADPELLAFFNVNTLDDYESAKMIYEKRGY